MTARSRWCLGLGGVVLPVGLGLWLILTDAPVYRFLVRLYADPELMRVHLHAWGGLAPLVFIAIQALQVIIAPIPGDVTGFLGGYVFGERLGVIYSTLGLTAGSLLAFGMGRWLGAAVVQRLVRRAVWNRLGFIVEAEGAILCFVIYLIPGLPKDFGCYLFGLSPMPFWVFALTSTVGRLPGTWILSAQGAKAATGHYLELALLTALLATIAVPLYYYRHQIVSRFQGRTGPKQSTGRFEERL